MNTEVRHEIRAAAHAAHTMSRLAIDYDRMATEYPWKRGKFLEEADRCRGDGWKLLKRARTLRELYA